MGIHANVKFTVNLADTDTAALAAFLADNQPEQIALPDGATPAEQVLALLCECGEYDNDGDIDPTTGEISVYVDGRYSDSVGLEELSLTGATIKEYGHSWSNDSMWLRCYSAGAMTEESRDISQMWEMLEDDMADMLGTADEARSSSDPDTLTDLAASDDDFIRAQVAANQQAPASLLARLAADDADSVRRSARRTLGRPVGEN